MKNIQQFLVFFAVGAIFVSFVLILTAPVDKTSKTQVPFTVEKGQGAQEIGKNLVEARLIRSDNIFFLYTLLAGQSSKLQAGEYSLSRSMSVPEIVGKMARGDIAKETLTIIEGWNRREIAQYLQEKGIPGALQLEGAAYVHLEGHLFPDTYYVRKGALLDEVIVLMQENFEKKVSKEMQEQKNIIMASLIEKEVQTMEDKRIVSGILWKRLERGMLLQVDATIAFITGKRATKISLEDTRIDSPYNTYRYKGLPPGAISNPGLESIQAAFNPQENPYLYYLSTPEGETIFSRTLEDHNKAKTLYLAD